jgi:hypothetical protein
MVAATTLRGAYGGGGADGGGDGASSVLVRSHVTPVPMPPPTSNAPSATGSSIALDLAGGGGVGGARESARALWRVGKVDDDMCLWGRLGGSRYVHQGDRKCPGSHEMSIPRNILWVVALGGEDGCLVCRCHRPTNRIELPRIRDHLLQRAPDSSNSVRGGWHSCP